MYRNIDNPSYERRVNNMTEQERGDELIRLWGNNHILSVLLFVAVMTIVAIKFL